MLLNNYQQNIPMNDATTTMGCHHCWYGVLQLRGFSILLPNVLLLIVEKMSILVSSDQRTQPAASIHVIIPLLYFISQPSFAVAFSRRCFLSAPQHFSLFCKGPSVWWTVTTLSQKPPILGPGVSLKCWCWRTSFWRIPVHWFMSTWNSSLNLASTWLYLCPYTPVQSPVRRHLHF